MGIFDKVNKNNNKYNNKTYEETHEIKTQKHQTAEEREQINPLDTDPKAYTSPSYPLSEQAKDKLSANAVYKSVLQKTPGFFNDKVRNLDMDSLKYVIKESEKDGLYDYFKSNKIPEKEKLGLNLPDFIYGGGENDLIPVDGIDFKKTYNSEAQALMVNYYSSPENIKQIRKMLYLTAASYYYGTYIDTDELKKKVDESGIEKLSNIEAKIEFEKLFGKMNYEENKGKILFIKSMLNRLDKLEKNANEYKNAKLDVFAEIYGKSFTKTLSAKFGIPEGKNILIDNFVEKLRPVVKYAKANGNETLSDIDKDSAPDIIKENLAVLEKYDNGKNQTVDVLNKNLSVLEDGIKAYDDYTDFARKQIFSTALASNINVNVRRYIPELTSRDILLGIMGKNGIENLQKNKKYSFLEKVDTKEVEKYEEQVETAYKKVFNKFKKSNSKLKNMEFDDFYGAVRENLINNIDAYGESSLRIPDDTDEDIFADNAVSPGMSDKCSAGVLNDAAGFALLDRFAENNKFYIDNEKNGMLNGIKKEIFTKSADEEILNKIKPAEIEDTHNVLKLIGDIADGKINNREVEKILNSKFFERNTIINSEDKKENLKSFLKDFSKKTETMNQNKIFKKLTDEEVNRYIASKHYTDIDNKVNSASTRIMMGLAGNAEIMRKYDMCIEKSGISENSMSTPASNMKNCVDNLINELERAQKEYESEIFRQQRVFNPLIAAAIIVTAMRASVTENIKSNIELEAVESAKKLKLINDALVPQERFAKMSLLKADDMGVSQDIIDPEYKDLYKHAIKSTALLNDMTDKYTIGFLNGKAEKVYNDFLKHFELDDKTLKDIENIRKENGKFNTVKENIKKYEELTEKAKKLKEEINKIPNIDSIEKTMDNFDGIENYKKGEYEKIPENAIFEKIKEYKKLLKEDIPLLKEKIGNALNLKNIEITDNVKNFVSDTLKTTEYAAKQYADIAFTAGVPAVNLSEEDALFLKKFTGDYDKNAEKKIKELKEYIFNLKIFKESIDAFSSENKINKDIEKIQSKYGISNGEMKKLINGYDLKTDSFKEIPFDLKEKIENINSDEMKILKHKKLNSISFYMDNKKEVSEKYLDGKNCTKKNIDGKLKELEEQINRLETKNQKNGITAKQTEKMINFYKNRLEKAYGEKLESVEKGLPRTTLLKDAEIKLLKSRLAVLKINYMYNDSLLGEKLADRLHLKNGAKKDFIKYVKENGIKKALSDIKKLSKAVSDSKMNYEDFKLISKSEFNEKFNLNGFQKKILSGVINSQTDIDDSPEKKVRFLKSLFYRANKYSDVLSLNDLKEIKNTKELTETLQRSFEKTLDMHDDYTQDRLTDMPGLFNGINGNIMTTAVDEKAVYYKTLANAVKNGDAQTVERLSKLGKKLGINELSDKFIEKALSMNEKDKQMKINMGQIGRYKKRTDRKYFY